jgi:hypothetical protein
VDKNRLPKWQADKRLFGRLSAFRFKGTAFQILKHPNHPFGTICIYGAAGLRGFVATGGCFIEAV